jgi:hypothetical protein
MHAAQSGNDGEKSGMHATQSGIDGEKSGIDAERSATHEGRRHYRWRKKRQRCRSKSNDGGKISSNAGAQRRV